MTKIGRNAPCPCGSGKKYKKCCLGKNIVSSQAVDYRRLSEAHDRLIEKLMPFATQVFGQEVVDVAMDDFLLWPEPEDDIQEDVFDRIGSLLWSWLLFNWEYDSQTDEHEEVGLSGPEHRTIAELYAEDRASKLYPIERRLIDAVNRKPYSFWEVLSVYKGTGMKLLDLFIGTTIEVQERTGSEYVSQGDLLYGKRPTNPIFPGKVECEIKISSRISGDSTNTGTSPGYFRAAIPAAFRSMLMGRSLG